MKRVERWSLLECKIEREIYTYINCIYMDYLYDDVSNQIGVSERTFYKYISELRKVKDEVKKSSGFYDYQKNNAITTKDKHYERLKRLVSIIELFNTQELISKDIWNEHIKNIPVRMRQRDFEVLRKSGFVIKQNKDSYWMFFEF